MFQEFGIVGIQTSLMEKKISIEFSLDVNADTATRDRLLLVNKETGQMPNYTIDITRKVITLELVEWPIPNTEYLLKVQKGITSIVDDELPDSLQRGIVFKSEITSLIEVLTPGDHEKLSELFLSWKEVPVDASENLVNSYCVEVAKENVFYSTVKQSYIHDKQEVAFTDLPAGQYYARVRAQKDGEYGRWSDIVTFIIGSKSVEPEPDDDEPIFEDGLEIVTAPPNGETPKSFLIEFDDDIDPDSIQEIVVIRRLI